MRMCLCLSVPTYNGSILLQRSLKQRRIYRVLSGIELTWIFLKVLPLIPKLGPLEQRTISERPLDTWKLCHPHGQGRAPDSILTKLGCWIFPTGYHNLHVTQNSSVSMLEMGMKRQMFLSHLRQWPRFVRKALLRYSLLNSNSSRHLGSGLSRLMRLEVDPLQLSD